jgi:methylisocitrate lyase
MAATRSSMLRDLMRAGRFLHMPSVWDPLGGRLVESLGFPAAYVGGYVTGAARAVSEPLLTMDEQVATARAVAQEIDIPVIADAGAGFGEPLHAMRTVREFVRAGIAGIHIEDQLYPKRAHYHKYVAHAIDRDAFVEKIRFAAAERDRLDRDFVVIARTDTCRFFGLGEASARINAAAAAGADLGLLFPRDLAEAEAAPKMCRLPLVYVQSRGNRDGRPIIPRGALERMGYVACIEAQLVLLAALDAARAALVELRDTGDYAGTSEAGFVASRKAVEDLIRLEDHYDIEARTVERGRDG